jgi:ABC-type nitrate/sulfonate/bicarbonate transport system substrate-binding protein
LEVEKRLLDMERDPTTGNGDEQPQKTTTTSDGRKVQRRDVLAAGGAAAAATVAGCLATGGSDDPADTVATGGSDDTTDTETALPSAIYRHNFRRMSMNSGVRDGTEQKGIWREEGVDVDFKSSTGAKKAAKAVASGNAAFGNGDYGTLVQMINKGAPLSIIGHIHYPLDGVVATGDWLDSFTDLEGKTVAKYDPKKPRLREAIRRDGGDPEKVNWQIVNPGSATKLLANGEVDAASAYWPPNVIRLQSRGIETSALSTSKKLNYIGMAVYTNTNVIEKQPDAVGGFLRGVMKGWKWGANNPKEVAEVYRENADVSEEAFDGSYQYKWFGYYLASMLPDRETAKEKGFGWVDMDRFQQTLDLYTEIDILDEADPAEEYVDLRWFEDNQDLAVETAEAILNRLDEDYEFGTDMI